jgi:hypothetical protein
MVNVKSLNLDNRTGLSASRLNGNEQSRHECGYGESYGGKEESYWPQQWCALWPAQSDLDLILLAFFSLSQSIVISDRALRKVTGLQRIGKSDPNRSEGILTVRVD